MTTKYQIFVSSTYEDLVTERDVVIKAILEMGHIPVGMEMFSAADDEQWQIIARHIEQSDYYCVLVAHRYGSSIDGLSFTRKEYEYAVSCGVPILGFVIDADAQWPPQSIDKGTDSERLDEFKSLVKSKPVSFWKSADDLHGKVSIALMKQMTANPREGWVRSSALEASPQVTSELTRLSAENAALRGEIAAMDAASTADHKKEVKAAFDELQRRDQKLAYKYASSDPEWSRANHPNALHFLTLAPMLASEVALKTAAEHLAMAIREDTSKSWWMAANNQVRDMFSDWMAMDLVEPSKKKHAPSDTTEYWSLTEFGNEVHKYARRRMMRLRDSADPEGDAEDGDASSTSAIDSPSTSATREARS